MNPSKPQISHHTMSIAIPPELNENLKHNKVHIDINMNGMNELSILQPCQVKNPKTWFEQHDDLIAIYRSSSRRKDKRGFDASLSTKTRDQIYKTNINTINQVQEPYSHHDIVNKDTTASSVKIQMPLIFDVLVNVAKIHEISLYSSFDSLALINDKIHKLFSSFLVDHIDALISMKVTSDTMQESMKTLLTTNEIHDVMFIEYLARLSKTNAVIHDGSKMYHFVYVDKSCDDFVLVMKSDGSVKRMNDLRTFIKEKLKICLLKDVKTLAADLGVPLSKVTDGKRTVLNKSDLIAQIETKLK